MSQLLMTTGEILKKRSFKQIITSISRIEADIKSNLTAIEFGRISKDIRQNSIEMNILLSKRLVNLYEAKEILSPTSKIKENNDFWENRKRVKELAAMDNQPTDNWDVCGSY